ncbi:MAG: S41 family peptidase [Fibrobacterota bacterium]
MRKKSSPLKMTAVIIAFLAVFCIAAGTLSNFHENLVVLQKIAVSVKQKYVIDVDTDELVEAAVEGMKEVLDPHTSYFSPKDFSRFMESTKGKFGGLGIQIGIREKALTIITPLPGTPAYRMGILAGDKIIEINGKPTKGITINEAVNKLRGKVGTEVDITIDREGEKKPLEYTIERELVEVHPVDYSGMIEKDVGFIKLVQFSDESTNEVRQAVNELMEAGAKGIILDLRNNPGGLLTKAVEISDLFLEEEKLIVYTRGRIKQSNVDHYSKGPAIVPEGFPVVVLLNYGSASASEIVAGAIQDYDRGVILGRTSYGKGSVQTFENLENKKAIKITTAYYYTPSGRCINKPENQAGHPLDEDEENPEDDSAGAVDADSTESIPDSLKFRTEGGRTVFGDGGITPDIDIKPDFLKGIEAAMERKSFFFRFAIKYIASLKAGGREITKEFEVTDEILKKFRDFLKETNFSYEMVAEKSLDDLQETLINEIKVNKGLAEEDSLLTKTENQEQIMALIEKIDNHFEKEKEHAFDQSVDYIKFAIKREIMVSTFGADMRYVLSLPRDSYVKEAVSILHNTERYNSIVSPDKK